MEKTRSQSFRTQFRVHTKKVFNKKPTLLGDGSSNAVVTPVIRVSILSKVYKVPSEHLETTKKVSLDYTEKLPELRPKHSKLLKKEVRQFNYSKWVPKIHMFKPLFHERYKSCNYTNEEDSSFLIQKNKLDWFDY